MNQEDCSHKSQMWAIDMSSGSCKDCGTKLDKNGKPVINMTQMRRFRLLRSEDESGVSGIGYVAEGVEFNNGKCALSWNTKFTSIAIYQSILEMEAIHGHGGKTKVEFIDPETK